MPRIVLSELRCKFNLLKISMAETKRDIGVGMMMPPDIRAEIQHSILVITYNQQNYIRATLQSLVNQSIQPFEIIVLDDCSSDGNWDIIMEFARKYANIIKPYRNETNIGLQSNLKKIKTLYTGNVVSYCPGDDFLEIDAVKLINEAFVAMDIDPSIEPGLVVANSIHLYPDGRRILWNNYIERDKPLIKSRLRYSLSYRSVGFSRALNLLVPSESDIVEKSPGVGLSADFIKGFEEVLLAKHISFIDYPAAVYRLGVGVTSGESSREKWIVHQNVYKDISLRYNERFDRKDKDFIKFIISADELKINPSPGNFLRAFYLLVLNIGNFGFNNPLVRNLHYFVPAKFVAFLKWNIYPLYLKIRTQKAMNVW